MEVVDPWHNYHNLPGLGDILFFKHLYSLSLLFLHNQQKASA